MPLHNLFRAIHARTQDPVVRCWLRKPSVSEPELIRMLPDLLALAEARSDRDCRVGLLLRHFGLGNCTPEKVPDMARRDGRDPADLHSELNGAVSSLTRGLEDLVWLLYASPQVMAAHQQTAELSACAKDVLSALWQLPPDSIPTGLRSSAERLSALCAGTSPSPFPLPTAEQEGQAQALGGGV